MVGMATPLMPHVPTAARAYAPADHSPSINSTCVLSSDGLPTCVNCTVGHEGRYCERCMDGYFGRPKVSVRLGEMWNFDK